MSGRRPGGRVPQRAAAISRLLPRVAAVDARGRRVRGLQAELEETASRGAYPPAGRAPGQERSRARATANIKCDAAASSKSAQPQRPWVFVKVWRRGMVLHAVAR
jgi:hypothetical protein